MFDYIKMTQVEGLDSGRKLRLFGLSTCGYCKKALSYLNDTGLSYEYIFVDELNLEIKQQVKDEFKANFDKRMTFPSLVIDDEDYLIGFIKIAWDTLLLKE